MPRGNPNWKNGKSGNITGRPASGEKARLRRAAAELFTPHIETAVQTIVEICSRGEDHKSRLQAAKIILDRVYGIASQEINMNLDATIKAEIQSLSDRELINRTKMALKVIDAQFDN